VLLDAAAIAKWRTPSGMTSQANLAHLVEAGWRG
jgi:hypothetical protein